MKIEEYRSFDATALGQLVRTRQIPAQELLSCALEIAYKYNPQVNAIITFLEEEARQLMNKLEHRYQAPEKEVPFFGVPFLLKDLLGEWKGTKLTQASRAFGNYVSAETSELVQHYLNTGLIIFGKTNLPEFGIMGTTEPKFTGVTRNPWNLSHSTGGSSGGSAAAVALGMVPMAAGGDGGGSLRIPASCCGLFGLKPTRGRTSNGPTLGELWDGATVQHVVSRTVRDSATALDLSLNVATTAPYKLPRPEKSYTSLKEGAEKQKFKIGLYLDHPLREVVKATVRPEVKNAIHNFAKRLEGEGHKIEEISFPVDGAELARSYITMVAGQVAAQVEHELKTKKNGAKVHASDFELTTRALHLVGKAISASDFVQEKHKWHLYARALDKMFEQYDLIITPTLATLPTRIGELEPKAGEKIGLSIALLLGAGKPLVKLGLIEQIAYQSLSVVPYTQLANLTGIPAMSLPVGLGPERLPIGAHVMAPIGREDRLFQLAFQWESMFQWTSAPLPS